MRYWFEEPYEAYDELVALYTRHIHDQYERRFIIEHVSGQPAGLVELVEIDYIHRRAEFQIIIAPNFQGRGYAKSATRIAINYAFRALNLHKVYLVVDQSNAAAIHIYEQCGFVIEGILREEFFSNGNYHDAYRMGLLQTDYLRDMRQAPDDASVLRDWPTPELQTNHDEKPCPGGVTARRFSFNGVSVNVDR